MNSDTTPDRQVDHMAMVEAVRCAMAMLPGLDLSGIEVESEGDMIVLRGTCRSAQAAEHARQIAEEIAGAGHVRTTILIDRA